MANNQPNMTTARQQPKCEPSKAGNAGVQPEFTILPMGMYEELLSRLDAIEKQVNEQRMDNELKNRVLTIARKGVVTGGHVCQLLNWSPTTLWRKVNSGVIPMTKDGNRWKMDVDSFLKWHSDYFMSEYANNNQLIKK